MLSSDSVGTVSENDQFSCGKIESGFRGLRINANEMEDDSFSDNTQDTQVHRDEIAEDQDDENTIDNRKHLGGIAAEVSPRNVTFEERNHDINGETGSLTGVGSAAPMANDDSSPKNLAEQNGYESMFNIADPLTSRATFDHCVMSSTTLDRDPMPVNGKNMANERQIPFSIHRPISVKAGSGIDKIPEQRRKIVARCGAVFTLMVAGESGLGKTTFVNTLFGDQLKHRHRDCLYDTDTDADSKTTVIDLSTAYYEDKGGFQVKFTVIDTPGFGDFSNNEFSWVPILSHIERQHRMYMLQDEQPLRQDKKDTRVHACLYFIRPSGRGLVPLDIEVMKKLSRRVNLIPVIAKADSFTLQEREHNKKLIRQAIAENNIEVYCPPADDLSDMPYALICSTTQVGVDAKTGEALRGREYFWGDAQVENESHCDFVKLRKLLMSEYMYDLIDTTVEKHYELYRREAMVDRLFWINNEKLNKADLKAKIDDQQKERVQREALDMGAIQILAMMSTFGSDKIEKYCSESHPIIQYMKMLKERWSASVLSFQQQRFAEWEQELKNKQDELNADLAGSSDEVERLKAEVANLEHGMSDQNDSTDRHTLRSRRSRKFREIIRLDNLVHQAPRTYPTGLM